MSLATLMANPAIAAKLNAKTSTDASPKAHHITPECQVVDGMLILGIPLEEIGKSRPSKITEAIDEKTGKTVSRGGNLGFMLDRVEFEIEGRRFSLGSAWHTFGVK
jgi:hypothetical protein